MIRLSGTTVAEHVSFRDSPATAESLDVGTITTTGIGGAVR